MPSHPSTELGPAPVGPSDSFKRRHTTVSTTDQRNQGLGSLPANDERPVVGGLMGDCFDAEAARSSVASATKAGSAGNS